MATIVFGFFAVLIARELPGRQRVWPYLVAGVVVALLGFARLYLGAHWLSDVVGGMLLGIVWLLVLGIAYRRHVARSFWMRPLAWLFYGSFAAGRAVACAAQRRRRCWRSSQPPPPTVRRRSALVDDDWTSLPAQRNERDDAQRWPLDVQVAGPLAPLQRAAAGAGLARAAAGRLDAGARPARRRRRPTPAAGAAGHAGRPCRKRC